MGEFHDPDRDNLERHLEHELHKRGMTRGELVVGGGKLAAALGIGWLYQATVGGGTALAAADRAVAGAKFTGTLRVMGMGTDLIEPIRQAAEKDLGFKLAFEVADGATLRQKVATQPGAFDVYSDETAGPDIIWPTGNLVPIPRNKLTHWDQYTMLYKAGRVDPRNMKATVGDGDAAFRKQYVSADGKKFVTWPDSRTGKLAAGRPEPANVAMVGNVFNCDSFGYNSKIIKKTPTQMSWAELLNPTWKGRVALLNDANIGLQDAAIAAEARGMIKFKDLGNMTKSEIDGLVKILTKYKKQGHFRAFWTSFDQSVNLMSAGEVVLESMWSPAVSVLQSQGFPCKYAAPKEGYRGWWGGNFVSKEAAKDPAKFQAAIDYMNWWHSGKAGAIMMRQGYYSPVQQTSRQFVEPFEWAYWIEGKPASKPIPNPFGQKTAGVPIGTVRDGGSFKQRAFHYRSWNSTMDAREHQTARWNEFLAA
jgi:putative spermidine/putrescine transport system substrate-binding protein